MNHEVGKLNKGKQNDDGDKFYVQYITVLLFLRVRKLTEVQVGQQGLNSFISAYIQRAQWTIANDLLREEKCRGRKVYYFVFIQFAGLPGATPTQTREKCRLVPRTKITQTTFTWTLYVYGNHYYLSTVLFSRKQSYTCQFVCLRQRGVIFFTTIGKGRK